MCRVECIFFFKQKTAYELRISDWSSDVCSSDLEWQVERRRMKIVGSAETLNRIVAPAMLLLSLLAGCAGAPEASRSLAFASTRDTAIVIPGTRVNHAQREEVRAGRRPSRFWVEYDPCTPP